MCVIIARVDDGGRSLSRKTAFILNACRGRKRQKGKRDEDGTEQSTDLADGNKISAAVAGICGALSPKLILLGT